MQDAFLIRTFLMLAFYRFTTPETEEGRTCLMQSSGWQPCALMCRARGSRWSVTMVTILSCEQEIVGV
jgi:hypothetical protein